MQKNKQMKRVLNENKKIKKRVQISPKNKCKKKSIIFKKKTNQK